MTVRHLPLAALSLFPSPLLVPTIAFAEAPPPPEEYAQHPSPAEAPEEEPQLDPGIRRMIEIALAGDDEAAAKQVLAVARKAAPDSKAEIDAMEDAWRTRLASEERREKAKRLAELRAASALDNWKGEAEFGAYRSTGANENLGVLGSLDVQREGIVWTHKLNARAELQSTNGTTTSERIFAAYQPSRSFGSKSYSYGLAQYERDPFAGYASRYTLGGGFGVRLASESRFKMEVEGGPALRWTDDVETGTHSHLVGRGSVNLEWKITPTLSLTHKTAVYLESGDGNAQSDTALDTKLIGALKARFSYNIQYEGNPPIGTQELSTQSRATFVYSF